MVKIRKSSVNKAIDLFSLSKSQSLKNKSKLERSERTNNAQCKIVHCYKKSDTQCSVTFSKYGILSEIKSQASRRNWRKVKSLFLLLLRLIADIEPLIWRYNFILSLYSNMNNLSNVFQFFEMCIGNLDEHKNVILRNMLSLKHCK